jgi:hypothetical protein
MSRLEERLNAQLTLSVLDSKGGVWESETLIGRKRKKKLHGLSPQANYTDRATAACQRS